MTAFWRLDGRAHTFVYPGCRVCALVAVALTAALAACDAARPGFHGPDILYVATPEEVGIEMLRLAGTHAGDTVYDLGSGDGRLVIAAAREFGARGVGVELDPSLVQDARESATRAGVTASTRFVWQDLFATDIREATVVAIYLRDDVNLRLRGKLLTELAAGARVVSHEFGMGDWTPDRAIEVRGPDRMHHVLLWIVPARVDGAWRVRVGDREARLALRQRFQRLDGALQLDDRELTIDDGRVSGARVDFAAGGWHFSGRVTGDALHGTASAPDGTTSGWTARR